MPRWQPPPPACALAWTPLYVTIAYAGAGALTRAQSRHRSQLARSPAHALTDNQLTRLMRIWLANRGRVGSPAGSGPTVPVPATRADAARYVEADSELPAKLR